MEAASLHIVNVRARQAASARTCHRHFACVGRTDAPRANAIFLAVGRTLRPAFYNSHCPLTLVFRAWTSPPCFDHNRSMSNPGARNAENCMAEPTCHVPVMLAEIIEQLAPQPGQVIVDGTLGGGGHTRALAERVGPHGLVISLDRDPVELERGAAALAGLPVKLVESNFCDLPEVLEQLEIPAVDGIVLDLGLSSDQLADRQRGFSFDSAGPLDLRFNPDEGEPAARLVNRLSAEHLADLIFNFGEERYSRRIAKAIVERRRTRPIETSADFAELVRRSVPRPKPGDRIDPATRTFQALRIWVNAELKSLEIALRRLPNCLRPGGRLAIISFHSLEDRPVKEAFRQNESLEVLTRKPIRPSVEEVAANPRSRSAKLRVAQRI